MELAFAGLDVGTSGCKLLVYDLSGRMIFKASRKYSETGEGGIRELSPDTVLENVFSVLRETGEKCPVPIKAMAVTSLGESVVCLDENDRPLCNSMLTGDIRGIPETHELTESFGVEEIFQTTGLPPNELYGLPKYMWLNRNTDAIKRARYILFYEDFIGYMLTGERRVSYSSAARSMAFDIKKHAWSERLLSCAGIRKEQMSEPAPPMTVIGTILPEAAARLKLDPELKIAVGGHDQSMAALGSGLMDRDTAELGMGTCEFMFAMLPEPMTDSYMAKNDFTCIPYIFPDTYLTSLEVTTCGALKNWARGCIFRDINERCIRNGENFFVHMDKMAQEIKTDVLVLPQFGSSGNPDLSMDAVGTITGLTIHTRPEEIYRAILEGMAFQMYLAYERLRPLGVELKRIAATGGGSASELTLKIRADVFDMEVSSPESNESGTLGCMIIAAASVGAYSSICEGIKKAVRPKKIFEPDHAMHEYYMEKYERYKELYKKMNKFK